MREHEQEREKSPDTKKTVGNQEVVALDVTVDNLAPVEGGESRGCPQGPQETLEKRRSLLVLVFEAQLLAEGTFHAGHDQSEDVVLLDDAKELHDVGALHHPGDLRKVLSVVGDGHSPENARQLWT